MGEGSELSFGPITCLLGKGEGKGGEKGERKEREGEGKEREGKGG